MDIPMRQKINLGQRLNSSQLLDSDLQLLIFLGFINIIGHQYLLLRIKEIAEVNKPINPRLPCIPDGILDTNNLIVKSGELSNEFIIFIFFLAKEAQGLLRFFYV
jgi:hypothetical protein